MALQGEDESRTSSPPLEAMDKSLKVWEDEWRERERGGHKIYASNEVWTLKCNFSNYQSWKNTHATPLFIA